MNLPIPPHICWGKHSSTNKYKEEWRESSARERLRNFMFGLDARIKRELK